MRILVTGGAGFIGSHTVVELQQAGYDVVVLDNLCNASEKVIPRVEAITGKKVPFYKADILDREALEEIFSKEQIDAVIHFAGLKAVGESVQKPWEYYENNIAGTLTLVDVMRKHGVKSIIFSSSATVYGNPAFVPITEECLQHNAILNEQFSCTLHRIHTGLILDGGEFFSSDYLEGQAAVHLVDHIQYQALEFVAVGSLRLHRFSVLIQIRDLFLYDVQGHFLFHDLLQILYFEEVIQDNSVIIRR